MEITIVPQDVQSAVEKNLADEGSACDLLRPQDLPDNSDLRFDVHAAYILYFLLYTRKLPVKKEAPYVYHTLLFITFLHINNSRFPR